MLFICLSPVLSCYSFTGFQVHRSGPQWFYGNSRCFQEENRRQLSHEIGHLLGFFHEHNRPDRDHFIDIVWENIQDDKADQFKKRNEANVVSFCSPYDFGSIMQYPLDYYTNTKGKDTMVKKVKYDGPVGTNTRPSETDLQQLRYLYGCEPCKSIMQFIMVTCICIVL